ncbi:MAG: hypothetical protein ACI92E_001131 [Oceanicoccus sp.]|jgi:hypothetical protein
MNLFSSIKTDVLNRSNIRDNRVFSPVSYRHFRQHLANIPSTTVQGKGFETVIYDKEGDIQAIVHAASIDNKGTCYPAEYFIRTSVLSNVLLHAA